MHSIKICGVKSIAALSTITNARQKELFKKVEQGDKEAREELIVGNLRLVLGIVLSRFKMKDCLEDLFQVGCIGLIKTVDRYDVRRGVQFNTYATALIVGEIQNYLYTNDMIRVPNGIKRHVSKVLTVIDDLARVKYGEPTIIEVAEATGLSIKEVTDVLECNRRIYSFYETVSEDNTFCFCDMIEDVAETEEHWLSRIVFKNAIESLSEKERSVVQKRFFESMTQAEVGKLLGISQSMASRYERRAVKKLKMLLK